MALNSQPQYQGRDGSRACPTSSAPTECCLRPTSAGSADTLVKPPNMLKVSLTKHICGPDTGQCMSACDHQVQLPGTFLLNCSRLEILKLVLYCPGCQEVVARVQLKLLLLEILFIFVWVEVWVRIGSLFKRRKKKKHFQKLEKQPRCSELRSKWVSEDPHSSAALSCVICVTLSKSLHLSTCLVSCWSFCLPVPFASALGLTITHPKYIMIIAVIARASYWARFCIRFYSKHSPLFY